MCLANQEYYHQWSVEESHGCSLDLSAFTTEELDNITSEYTLQNTVGTRAQSSATRTRPTALKQTKKLLNPTNHRSNLPCFFSPVQDTFSVGVSFLSGKLVYISPQASPMLRTKPNRLQGTLFSELLAPQDVSTFYSSTAPCRLPPWASCTGSSKSPTEVL